MKAPVKSITNFHLVHNKLRLPRLEDTDRSTSPVVPDFYPINPPYCCVVFVFFNHASHLTLLQIVTSGFFLLLLLLMRHEVQSDPPTDLFS